MKMNDRWWHFNYKERNDDGTKSHYELSVMKQSTSIDLLLTNRSVEDGQQTVISLPLVEVKDLRDFLNEFIEENHE